MLLLKSQIPNHKAKEDCRCRKIFHEHFNGQECTFHSLCDKILWRNILVYYLSFKECFDIRFRRLDQCLFGVCLTAAQYLYNYKRRLELNVQECWDPLRYPPFARHQAQVRGATGRAGKPSAHKILLLL